MNKVILIGNVGSPPERKRFDSGHTATRFSLATNKWYKNGAGESVKETTWHNLIAWGKAADVIDKYVKKGDKLAITGDILYRKHEGKSYTDIIVREFEMLGGKNPASNNEEPSANKKNDNQVDDPLDYSDDLPF